MVFCGNCGNLQPILEKSVYSSSPRSVKEKAEQLLSSEVPSSSSLTDKATKERCVVAKIPKGAAIQGRFPATRYTVAARYALPSVLKTNSLSRNSQEFDV